MLFIYYTNFYYFYIFFDTRNEPGLRDKVLKNPELSLIGLDPKAILAKHQNDFSQVSLL